MGMPYWSLRLCCRFDLNGIWFSWSMLIPYGGLFVVLLQIKEESMKSIAIFVVASLLLEMLAPTLLYATKHLQGTQVEGNTRAETAEKAEEVADQAIQMFYEKDVTVMSRREIDPSKLRRGWHAYVVYTSEGVKETVTGQIFDKNPDGIVIQSRASALWRADRERWEIAYEDIDTLAVAKARRDIERWRRRTEGSLIVMSRGELDLLKLRKGWYAHVVYTSKGVEGTATGDILDKDADGIVIKSRAKSWKEWEIAYGDIDILVVAKDRQDIEGWIEAGEIIQRLQEQESRVRFKAPSISRGWIVGRLVKVSPDTFRILTKRGFDYVPHSLISNLEVSLGRHRNTGEGMIIGLGLGLAFVVSIAIKDARTPDEWEGFATALAILFGFPSIFISCTLIGFVTKSDRWAEVPPQRLNLSISPTPTRGLRAALSFNF